MKQQELERRIERLSDALEVAAERFTDPAFGCEWPEAAFACRHAVEMFGKKEKTNED